MVFAEIRRYLKTRGRASVDDLAARFDGDKSAIEGMLETLVARGQIIELGCGSCGSSEHCSFAGPKIYAYAGLDKLAVLASGATVCSSGKP